MTNFWSSLKGREIRSGGGNCFCIPFCQIHFRKRHGTTFRVSFSVSSKVLIPWTFSLGGRTLRLDCHRYGIMNHEIKTNMNNYKHCSSRIIALSGQSALSKFKLCNLKNTPCRVDDIPCGQDTCFFPNNSIQNVLGHPFQCFPAYFLLEIWQAARHSDKCCFRG